MTQRRTSRHLGGLGCVLLSAVSMLYLPYKASAYDASTRATCYQCWKNAFYWEYPAGVGHFRSRQGGADPTSFWQGAEMIEIVEDAIAVGCDNTTTLNALCAGFTNQFGTDWSWNTFNDDLAWASMTFSRAYQLTGNSSYLTLAKNAADLAYTRGWVTPNGQVGVGGEFQDTSNTSRPSCANGPLGDAEFMLFQELGDGNYEGRAANLYNWEVANTYEATSGAVNEGPSTGINPGWGVYFTYDSGSFATVANQIGKWANNSTAIANANHAGDWVQSHWGVNMQSFGDGSDGGGFNGICLRGLARTGYNVPFLQAACERAWACRNSSGLTDCTWTQRTSDTQSLFAWDASSGVAGMLCVPVLSFTNAVYKPVDNSNSGWNVVGTINSDVNNIVGAIGVGINNSSMGGDPAPNHAKQLIATCTIPENGAINIMNGSGTIVSARYLPVDGSNTGIDVSGRFGGGIRNVAINNTTMGSDPAPGHAKELKMVYTEGGVQETVVVLENSALNL